MKHRSHRAVTHLGIFLLVAAIAGCADDATPFVLFAPTDTPTPAITLTPSSTPTETPTPTPTLTPTPTSTPTPTPLPTPMALVVSVHAESVVKLHVEPDASSDIVGELSPGVFVPLVEVTGDGLWLKIGLETIGWVAGVDVSLSGGLLTGDATLPTRQALLQADTAVNVRSGPGTRNKVLGRLKAGQVVPVLGYNDERTWVKIPFAGSEGWVNAETVIIAGGDPTPTPTPEETATPEP